MSRRRVLLRTAVCIRLVVGEPSIKAKVEIENDRVIGLKCFEYRQESMMGSRLLIQRIIRDKSSGPAIVIKSTWFEGVSKDHFKAELQIPLKAIILF